MTAELLFWKSKASMAYQPARSRASLDQEAPQKRTAGEKKMNSSKRTSGHRLWVLFLQTLAPNRAYLRCAAYAVYLIHPVIRRGCFLGRS